MKTAGNAARPAPYVLSLLFFVSLGLGQFDVYAGFSIKPYMVVALVIMLYVAFHRRIRIKQFSLSEYLFGLFLLVVGGSFLVSQYPSQSLRFTANAVLLAGVYLVLRLFFTNLISLEKIQKSIASAGLVVALVNLAYYAAGLLQAGFHFKGNGVSYYGLLLDRDTPRLIGAASTDPNFTAAYLSVFLFYLLLQKGYYLRKVLLFAAIVLTFSRGAFVALAAALIMYYLFANHRTIRKSAVRSVLAGAVLIAGSIALLNAATGLNVTSTITSRFQEASEDGGSGRVDLWRGALQTFQEHPLYGIGANSSLSYNASRYGDEHYVHNTYLEVVSELGVIGFAVYLSGILLTLRAAIRSRVYGLNYPLLLYLGIILQMLFLSMMTHELYLLAVLMVAVYGLQAGGRHENQDA